ncbi:MAG: glycosyl transferase family 1 [Desulfovibrionaceae bacterium]|nr:glycosyl transferase family 1 [Desulfovibrionaceae bacterium]
MAGRLVLVLGMHRSGTSAMTRSLQCLGVDLCDSLIGHPCNPKVFFEDTDLCACNKTLLSGLGKEWHSPDMLDTTALMRMSGDSPGRQALALIQNKTAGRAILGLKDPRMCRLLPFWRPVLAAAGLEVHALLALRHPSSVAHSLARRDGMSSEHSHALWLLHTLDALSGSRGLPRMVVDYDMLLAEPERQVQRLGIFLSREPDAAQLADFAHDFLDKTLCHHQSGPTSAQGASLWEDMALRLYAALHPIAGEDGPLDASPLAPRLEALCLRLRERASRLPAPGRSFRTGFGA